MRNWTINEAVKVIKAGTDTEAIKEIAKHFPMFFAAVVKDDISALAAMMNDKFTVRRLQLDGVAVNEDADTTSDDVEESAGNDDTEGTTVALSEMSTKQLMALCDKRGIKVPHYGKNKQFYLDALEADANGAEDTEGEEEVEEAGDEYDSKSAMELFKMCKERGIKVAPKKKADVYAEALRKADAEAAEAEEDEAEDDWGDEEEEAPKKKAAKSEGKSAKKGATKKASKKEEAEEADDDDWDI